MWSKDTTANHRKAADKPVSSKFHISDIDPLRLSRISDSSTRSPPSELTPGSLARHRGISPAPGRAVPGHLAHPSPSSSSNAPSTITYLSRPISTARYGTPTTVTPSPSSLPRRGLLLTSSNHSPEASTPKSQRCIRDDAGGADESRRSFPSSSSSSSRSSHSSAHYSGRARYDAQPSQSEQRSKRQTPPRDYPISSLSKQGVVSCSSNSSSSSSRSSSSKESDTSDPLGGALRRCSVGEQGSRPSGIGSGQARGLVGLANLGNTCFLNSCLQCLAHTYPLLKAALAGPADRIEGTLSRAFVAVVRALWNQSPNSVFSPRLLLASLEDVAPQFSGYRQHDSQELLRALLEQLDTEQNRVERKAPYRELATDGVAEDVLARDAWDYHLSRHNSLIQDLFCGQLQSTIECGSCHGRSHCFDPFLDLSLPIPKHLNRRVTLHDCISVFASEERLDGCDKYHCSKCKAPRPCKKQLRIFRLPPILVLHLKRFCGARFSLFSKDTTVVHFPLNSLDLTDFLAEGAGNGGGGGRAVYDLYAVSNHSGSLGSGHYTAHCKNPHTRSWYTYNDSHVSQMSESSIISSSAYLLFYQRRYC